MTLERISTGHFYVIVSGGRVGHVWKGCGGWAGSRHANGIEATGTTAKETANKIVAKIIAIKAWHPLNYPVQHRAHNRWRAKYDFQHSCHQ